MIFIKIRSVPAAFREETPFTGVPALLRSDIVALQDPGAGVCPGTGEPESRNTRAAASSCDQHNIAAN